MGSVAAAISRALSWGASRLARGPALSERSESKGDLTAYGRLWSAGMEMRSGEANLTEVLHPYRQSLWVYRCVRAIADSVKGIPLRLSNDLEGFQALQRTYRLHPSRRRKPGNHLRPIGGRKTVFVGKAEGDVIESGPAWQILARPNSYQDGPAFLSALTSTYLLRGKVAVVFDGLVGNRPSAMHVVDGRRFSAVWAKTPTGLPELIGYRYTPRGAGAPVPMALDEMKLLVLWSDGDDPLDGLSPNIPGRLAIATDYAASLFNASALNNCGELGHHIDFPHTLDTTQRDEFRASLAARHGGPSNAMKDLVTEGGVKVETLGKAMADLQFDQGKRTTRLEICCLYGVPPVVAGWVDAAGDSSAYTQNALQQFYQQTVFPFLDGLAPVLQEVVSRLDPRASLWWDVEDQPVVRAMRYANIEHATKLFAMGRPFADVNELLDLGLPERPWDEVGFLPAGLLPAEEAASGTVAPPIDEGPQPGDLPEEEPRSIKGPVGVVIERAAADRVWEAWIRSWNGLAKEFGKVVRLRLVRQERAVLAALKRAYPKSASGRKGPVEDVLASVFRDGADRKTWRSRVQAFVRRAQELGVRQALAEAGLAGDALNAAARRLLSNPLLTQAVRSETAIVSTKVDEATRQRVRDSLAEGMDAGEGYPDLAVRVQEVMGGRREDAARVARNAVATSLSKARQEGHVAGGFTHKIWLHSRGPGVRRLSHVAAEAEYRATPVPISDPFVVEGESLMYPRDPAGSPGNTINCQCLSIGVRVIAGVSGPKQYAAAIPSAFEQEQERDHAER